MLRKFNSAYFYTGANRPPIMIPVCTAQQHAEKYKRVSESKTSKNRRRKAEKTVTFTERVSGGYVSMPPHQWTKTE